MDLTVKFGRLEFKNPIVASAGGPTHSIHGLKKCIEAGVGGVCTKSISYDPESWSFQCQVTGSLINTECPVQL